MRSKLVTANTVASPNSYNALLADAAGGAALLVHQQLGLFTLSTNPTNGKTLTLDINGTNVVITFVSSIGSTAGNVLIGASAVATCANLLSLLLNPTITNSTQVAIGVNTSINVTLVNYLSYSLSGTTLTISSLNTLLNAPLTSFSGSTNATSDSYTAQTMQLYVEPGVFYIAGTRVIFAGGSTPTVTAPSSHPRIDVLSINSSGTLSWTTGTENASPVAPTYPSPATSLVLGEVTNVVSETQLLDNANQSASQGFVSTDVRSFQQPSMNWGAFPTSLIPDGDGTRNLGSASFEWGTVYAKNAIIVNGASVASARFGGTGTDGALSVTSGTTTISAGNVSLFIKNYTSISITSTGTVAFSNPATNGTIIYLRSQGNVTLTSSAAPMLDGSGMGGTGGAVPGSSSTSNAGSNGFTLDTLTHLGGAGATGTSGNASGGVAYTLGMYALTAPIVAMGLKTVYTGSGGGSGVWSSATKNVQGGNGGGAFIIECGGAYNFTTAGGISVAGQAGGGITNTLGVSGGGGGSAGMCLVIYSSLTANSGTVTATGGSGGGTSSSSGGGNPCPGGGGGGGGAQAAGGAGAAAQASGNAGQSGSNAAGVGAGGGGASGWGGGSGSASGGTGGANDTNAYLAVQNYWFS